MIFGTLHEVVSRDQAQLFVDLAKENITGAKIYYPAFNNDNTLTRDEVHKDYRILHHLNNETSLNDIKFELQNFYSTIKRYTDIFRLWAA